MTCSFPGEDSIRARAIDAHNGSEAPEEHYPACPCYDRDDCDLNDCECEVIAEQEREDARVDAMLANFEW